MNDPKTGNNATHIIGHDVLQHLRLRVCGRMQTSAPYRLVAGFASLSTLSSVPGFDSLSAPPAWLVLPPRSVPGYGPPWRGRCRVLAQCADSTMRETVRVNL